MKIFYNIFLQNFSKIFSKTHQIAPFLKSFSGEHARTPCKRVALLHGVSRHANTPPPLQKYCELPPK